MRRGLRARAVAGLAATVMLGACTSTPERPPAARPLDPDFDAGQRVEITADGAVPRQLVAVVDTPITWVNLTDQPVTVTFDNGTVDSGPIPPQGTWEHTPDASVSIAYHTTAAPEQQATVQVEPREPADQG